MVDICDHVVGNVSAMGLPIMPTQPSIPPGSVIIWITGMETIKRQTGAAYGCLIAGQSVGADLAHGL